VFSGVNVRDDLPAVCDFRSSSRIFAIAYYSIPWKSVWRDCATVLSDRFWCEHIDVVPWPHLLVCVFKIAVVCMWRVLLRSYAAIFFLLLAVISVQVEHLPSLAVFSENLFGSTARSFLADRSWCEVCCTLASYRGRICQFLCSILLLYACKECYYAAIFFLLLAISDLLSPTSFCENLFVVTDCFCCCWQSGFRVGVDVTRILWGRRMRPSRPASIGICGNTS